MKLEGVHDLTGSTTPLRAETTRELDPDRDVYVAQFEAAIRHALDQGFLLQRDAVRLRAEAAAARIPRSRALAGISRPGQDR